MTYSKILNQIYAKNFQQNPNIIYLPSTIFSSTQVLKVINHLIFIASHKHSEIAHDILAYKILKFYGWNFGESSISGQDENLSEAASYNFHNSLNFEARSKSSQKLAQKFKNNQKKVANNMQLWNAVGALENFLEDLKKYDKFDEILHNMKWVDKNDPQGSNLKAAGDSSSPFFANHPKISEPQANFLLNHHGCKNLIKFQYLGCYEDLETDQILHKVALLIKKSDTSDEFVKISETKTANVYQALQTLACQVLKSKFLVAVYTEMLAKRWSKLDNSNFLLSKEAVKLSGRKNRIDSENLKILKEKIQHEIEVEKNLINQDQETTSEMTKSASMTLNSEVAEEGDTSENLSEFRADEAAEPQIEESETSSPPVTEAQTDKSSQF